MSYTLDGVYKSERVLDGYFTNMVLEGENNCILYRNFSSNSVWGNLCRISLLTGEVAANFHQYNSKQVGISYLNSTFDLLEDNIYFFSEHDYNIYKISNDSTLVDYYIDFGKAHVLPEESRFLPYEELKNLYNSHVVNGIDNLRVFEDKILFDYVYSGVNNLVVYDIHKRKVVANGYLCRSLKLPYLSHELVGKRGQQVITATNATSIVNGLKYGTDEFIAARRKLDISLTVKPHDNPVLTILDLK